MFIRTLDNFVENYEEGYKMMMCQYPYELSHPNFII